MALSHRSPVMRHEGMPPFEVLRRGLDLIRRAGCPHPAKPARRNRQARNPRISTVDSPVGAAISRPNRTAGTTMAPGRRDLVMAA